MYILHTPGVVATIPMFPQSFYFFWFQLGLSELLKQGKDSKLFWMSMQIFFFFFFFIRAFHQSLVLPIPSSSIYFLPKKKKGCYIGGTQKLHEKTLNPFNQKKEEKSLLKSAYF